MASAVLHHLPAEAGVGTLPPAAAGRSSSVLGARSVGGRAAAVVVVHGGLQNPPVSGSGRGFRRQYGESLSGRAVMRRGWLVRDNARWQQPNWRSGGVVVMAAEGNPEDSNIIGNSGSGIAVEDIVKDDSGDVEGVEEDEEDEEEEEEEEGEQLSPEEEEDQQNIDDILRILELLRTRRDMTFTEAKLTISIEDPRDVERRRMLNIEDDRGCSREDLGNALAEVYEGRVPQDKLVLRELAKEMLNWPNLDEDLDTAERTAPVASPYAKATDTGVDPKVAGERANVEWDSASDFQPAAEKESNLPPAVGISFLYLVTSIPIIIGVVVVAILFFNSLQ